MNFGKITGEAIEAYHASETISHSKLEVFRKRALLYRKRFIARSVPAPESDAYVIGNALHSLVLEGADAYSSRFAVRPDGIDRRTKIGKEAWEVFVSANAGKAILDADDECAVLNMTAAIAAHPVASALLTGGEAEVTWRTPATALPLPLQCRTDYFNAAGCKYSDGLPYIADIKTVESLDSEEFRNFDRAFYSFGYHRQAGFYMPLLQDCGVNCWNWFFICVEKNEPFGCVVYKPSADAVSVGVDESVEDLLALAKCYKTGIWPNLTTEIQEISLPTWYGKKAVA